MFAVLHVEAGLGEFAKQLWLAREFLTDGGADVGAERGECEEYGGGGTESQIGNGVIAIESHIRRNALRAQG